MDHPLGPLRKVQARQDPSRAVVLRPELLRIEQRAQGQRAQACSGLAEERAPREALPHRPDVVGQDLHHALLSTTSGGCRNACTPPPAFPLPPKSLARARTPPPR